MDRRSMLKTSGTLAGLAALNQSGSAQEKTPQQAGIAFDMLMEVRNKLVEAYREVQQMRV